MCEERDLDAVAALERLVFSDPWSRRSFEELLDLDHVRGFVVEDDAEGLLGYAVCSRVADEGEILNLASVPAARRQGIGRRLLEAVLDWMRATGAARVFLEVRRSNDAAIGLYAAAGFATLGVRRNYYRMPTEDAVTMALDLGSGPARKGYGPPRFRLTKPLIPH